MGNIFDYTQAELTEWLGKQGIQPFRARQIFKWLYVHQATSFDQMTDIAKPLRTILSEEFHMGAMTIVEKQSSQDNTCKYLFELEDGSHIEAVRIPQKDRFTLCVSSQVGCAMDCQFCLTAKSGLRFRLWHEIFSQAGNRIHLRSYSQNDSAGTRQHGKSCRVPEWRNR